MKIAALSIVIPEKCFLPNVHSKHSHKQHLLLLITMCFCNGYCNTVAITLFALVHCYFCRTTTICAKKHSQIEKRRQISKQVCKTKQIYELLRLVTCTASFRAGKLRLNNIAVIRKMPRLINNGWKSRKSRILRMSKQTCIIIL